MYPPIFPLLLAPLYHWFGLALRPMKVECICFFMVALYFVYLLVKNESSEWVALATVALIGFCPYFWDFKDVVYSEFPFLAFAYAALYLGQRSEQADPNGRTSLACGAAVGILSYLAYGTRTVGFLVLGAILLRQLVLWRRVTRFSLAAGAVFVIGVIAQKLVLRSSPDYVGSFLRVVTVRDFFVAPWHYFVGLPVLWENGRSSSVQWLTYGITGLLAARCAWARWREKWRLIDIFAVLYGFFIIWFPWGGKRYLIPIMPFYVFYVLSGLEILTSGSLRPARLWLSGALAALVIGGFVSEYSTMDWAEIADGIQRSAVTEMVQYVKDHIGPKGMVVFEKPRFLSLYAETRASDIYEVPQTDEMLRYYRKIGVTDVIIPKEPVEERTAFLFHLMIEKRSQFEKIFENGAFAIYKFK